MHPPSGAPARGIGGQARYSFLSNWLLRSPREPIFEAIHDQAGRPKWWRGVEAAEEVRPGDENGLGTVSRTV